MLLQIGASHRLPDVTRDQREFYSNLQLNDLVLARACSEGSDAAWECFVATYRDMLQSAALSLCRDAPAGQELVASLLGDLFGTAVDRNGRRRSKLASYTGRGTLAGWLRATLAQTWVDQHRAQRRYLSLEEALPILSSRLSVPETISSDPRLGPAIEHALRELGPESRFLLKAYYLDEIPLARIGTMLGAHESTISRRISKVTSRLRNSILKLLIREGMSVAAARGALRSDVRVISADVHGTLLQNPQPVPEL